jgi:hypothetical protein
MPLSGRAYRRATGTPVIRDRGRHQPWRVTELNTTTGALIRVLNGPAYEFRDPSAITVDGTRIWVTNAGDDSVTEFPASPR